MEQLLCITPLLFVPTLPFRGFPSLISSSLSPFNPKGGHVDCVRYLLGLGAEVNYQDLNGLTPLHNAAFKANLQCARLLVRITVHFVLFQQSHPKLMLSHSHIITFVSLRWIRERM
jgi:hypothetical protein